MSIDDVTDVTPRVQYVASAAQTAFDYPFPVFQDADLAVYVDDVEQVLTTDYTVTGEGEDLGGIITFVTPMTGGEVVTIYRDTVIERTSDVQQNGPIASSTFNDEFDKAYTIMQELKAKIGRAIRFPFTAAITDTQTELSPLSNYLGKFLRVSAAGILEAAEVVSSVVPLTQSLIGQLLNPRTAAEISAGVTPTSYQYEPGNTNRGDISRYGVTIASSAASVAAAVQAALAAHGYAFIPAGDWPWNPVLFTATRQRIYGDGYRTQLIYSGSGTGIDFDGYAGCEISDLVLVCTNAAIGIDIGPNATPTRYPHWWRLRRVMVIGNTPNWATTSLATTRSGLTTSGIQVQTAFYGMGEHVEVSYAAGNGFRMFAQANGNTWSGCHSRDNAIGVKVEGTGTGNSNGNAWLGGNIEASIAGSIGIDIGEADRNRFTGRMEVSATSGIHVRVNPPSSTTAQENKFDLELTGTSKGYELGDGSGSSQVKGTYIHGGPFGSEIDINSDCLQTVIHASPTGLAGVTVNDDGYGTILRGDLGGGKWYEKPSNQNGTAYRHDLLVGTGSVDETLGDNAKTMQFTSYSDAFQWKKVNAGGTNLAVMMFGAYRVWVSPTDGKMYLKGTDPTTHNDGTVIGTQT